VRECLTRQRTWRSPQPAACSLQEFYRITNTINLGQLLSIRFGALSPSLIYESSWKRPPEFLLDVGHNCEFRTSKVLLEDLIPSDRPAKFRDHAHIDVLSQAFAVDEHTIAIEHDQ
jgi:hypothetical protein